LNGTGREQKGKRQYGWQNMKKPFTLTGSNDGGFSFRLIA
jgi:hypothetical protein